MLRINYDHVSVPVLPFLNKVIYCVSSHTGIVFLLAYVFINMYGCSLVILV